MKGRHLFLCLDPHCADQGKRLEIAYGRQAFPALSLNYWLCLVNCSKELLNEVRCYQVHCLYSNMHPHHGEHAESLGSAGLYRVPQLQQTASLPHSQSLGYWHTHPTGDHSQRTVFGHMKSEMSPYCGTKAN